MPQLFHCLHCKTVWTETDNNWILLQEVTCPFCNRKQAVKIEMKGGQLVGTLILFGSAHVKETR